MTTVTSIITSALRETNLIPLGVSPTQVQIDEGFGLLSTIVAGVLGNEAGENLNPIPIGQEGINAPRGYPWWSNQLPANMYMPTNARVMCNLTAPGMINLHPKPHDGARMGIVDVSQNFDVFPFTINGNGRSIEGEESMVYSTAGEIRQWVYREDLGNWVTVIPLNPNGEMPWPPEFDDMFIISLAMRLNPRYGQVMHPASVEALKIATTKFAARYSQSTTAIPAEDGLRYLTHFQRYWGYGASQYYGDPDVQFNSGFPY